MRRYIPSDHLSIIIQRIFNHLFFTTIFITDRHPDLQTNLLNFHRRRIVGIFLFQHSAEMTENSHPCFEVMLIKFNFLDYLKYIETFFDCFDNCLFCGTDTQFFKNSPLMRFYRVHRNQQVI